MRNRSGFEDGRALTRFLFGIVYDVDTHGSLTEDVALLRRAGVNAVRIGEGVRRVLERAPGVYDFAALDAAIDLFSGAEIDVVLTIPAPPPGPACAYAPESRSSSQSIVAAMAERYRSASSVLGWYTADSRFESAECSCSSCTEQFHHFLERNFHTVDELSAAWGCSPYSSFEHVPLAETGDCVTPAHILALRRFRAEQAAETIHEEIRIIRAARPDWWIAGGRNGISSWPDAAAVRLFPMIHAPEVRQIRGASDIDRARSSGGQILAMSLQAGASRDRDMLSDTPRPGQMRLFAYQAVAHGADGLFHDPFRTVRRGIAQYAGGIVAADGHPGARFEEFSRESTELACLGPLLEGAVPIRDVGIVLDSDVSAWTHLPHSTGLPSHGASSLEAYRVFRSAGYAAGYLHPSAPFSPHRLLVLPAMSVVSDEFVQRLTTFVEMGGTLFVTSGSGTKDAQGNLVSDRFPGNLTPLCGVQIAEASRINFPDATSVAVRLSTVGSRNPVVDGYRWVERLEPVTAETLGTWVGDLFPGSAALTLNHVGLGTVIYLGTFPGSGNLRPLLFPLAGEAGIQPVAASNTAGVEVAVREGQKTRFIFVLNHTDGPITQRLTPPGEVLIGPDGLTGEVSEVELSAYDVAVLRVSRANT